MINILHNINSIFIIYCIIYVIISSNSLRLADNLIGFHSFIVTARVQHQIETESLL